MINRKSLMIALGLLALADSRARAQVADPALVDAVRAYDSRMSLTADPGRVQVADFTGDDRADVAAVVEGNGKSALVIFNRTPTGYAPHALYASLPQADYRLRIVPPGRYRVLGGQGSVDVPAAGLELVFPGRSSAMYVWKGDRYQVHGTENYR